MFLLTPNSQFLTHLGNLHAKRLHIKEAISLYEKAIKFGNANAIGNLAYMYLIGKHPDGVNVETAISLCEEAIKLNHPDSMYTLAWIYETGK